MWENFVQSFVLLVDVFSFFGQNGNKKIINVDKNF